MMMVTTSGVNVETLTVVTVAACRVVIRVIDGPAGTLVLDTIETEPTSTTG